MLALIPRPFLKILLLTRALLTRAMTLGVKGVVCDRQGRVLLVRHTYVDGWHIPGGAVERGATLAETVARELKEEAWVTLNSRPRHFHTYRNPRTSRFDHVAVFICDEWEQEKGWVPNTEIAELGFFALDDLPETTTEYTRTTLKEIFGNAPARDVW